MKLNKRASKRQSTRHVEGIKKKVAAHHRKQRKLSKKDPTWRSKSKKDPGIPSMFPYKDRILQDIEDKKQSDLAEKLRKREELAAAKRAERIANGEDPEDIDNEMDEEVESNPLAALLESAQAAAREYEDDDDSSEDEEDDEDIDDDEEEEAMSVDGNDGISAEDLILNPDAGSTNDTSRKSFDRLFKKVVDAADVILYVLDARDPQGTRSKQVEHEILAHVDKRLIFVLNKIDLVPKESLDGWVKYLSNFFPTIPVRASTSSSSSDTFNHGSLNSSAVSASNLSKCLKSFASKSQLKRSIVVGVIGYPNVGKSSIINALVSRHGHNRSAVACPVGAEAGVTTSLREIKIDNKLRIIDSPGIVFPSEGKSATYEKSRLVLMSALPPKQIDDPISAATLILKRIIADEDQYKQLEKFYNLPALVGTSLVDKASNFLLHVARSRGRIGKKGIPNLESAAMCVINDWRDSRITRWTLAPTNSRPTSTSNGQDVASAATASNPSSDRIVIVKEWAKEFSLDDLLSTEEETAMQE